MRWEQSSVVLAIIGLLFCVLLFVVLAFRVKKKSQTNGYRNFRFIAFASGLSLLAISFAVLITVIALSFERVNTKSIGLGAWVCGRQIDVEQKTNLSGYFKKENSFYSDKSIKLKDTSPGSFKLDEVLNNSGIITEVIAPTPESVDVRIAEISLPISKEFEFNISSKSQSDELSKSLSFTGERSEPYIVLRDGAIKCVDESRWNVFLLSQVSDSEYTSTLVSADEFAQIDVDFNYLGSNSSLTSCIILDYDAPLDHTQKICKEFLDKNLKLREGA